MCAARHLESPSKFESARKVRARTLLSVGICCSAKDRQDKTRRLAGLENINYCECEKAKMLPRERLSQTCRGLGQMNKPEAQSEVFPRTAKAFVSALAETLRRD